MERSCPRTNEFEFVFSFFTLAIWLDQVAWVSGSRFGSSGLSGYGLWVCLRLFEVQVQGPQQPSDMELSMSEKPAHAGEEPLYRRMSGPFGFGV